MYCVKCGVELADSEVRCPLCGTTVFHPELEREPGEAPFPPPSAAPEVEVSRSGMLFIITVLSVLPAIICLLCDWRINGRLIWSGYAAGGILLCYLLLIFPRWFRHPNPVIFVPVDFAAVIVYLLYVNFAVGGHWFLSFAFPVTGALGLLVTALVAMLKYIHRGHLLMIGGAIILGGGLMVLVEFLLTITFHLQRMFFWSIYPLTAGILLGAMLIIIGCCRPLRESLHKKFFL